MLSHPTELTSVSDLDLVLAERERPILIFKHSVTCGTSAFAFETLLDGLADGDIPIPVYVVHVRHARAVSNALEARLRLRHESPQAILVRDGQLMWAASHHRITRESLRGAIARATAAAGASAAQTTAI